MVIFGEEVSRRYCALSGETYFVRSLGIWTRLFAADIEFYRTRLRVPHVHHVAHCISYPVRARFLGLLVIKRQYSRSRSGDSREE